VIRSISIPSVVKTLKMYCEARGKSTVYRFRTLFKDLPLKYQNVTVLLQLKYPNVYWFSDPRSRPSSNHLSHRDPG
jgi:hypothetical protein